MVERNNHFFRIKYAKQMRKTSNVQKRTMHGLVHTFSFIPFKDPYHRSLLTSPPQDRFPLSIYHYEAWMLLSLSDQNLKGRTTCCFWPSSYHFMTTPTSSHLNQHVQIVLRKVYSRYCVLFYFAFVLYVKICLPVASTWPQKLRVCHLVGLF